MFDQMRYSITDLYDILDLIVLAHPTRTCLLLSFPLRIICGTSQVFEYHEIK